MKTQLELPYRKSETKAGVDKESQGARAVNFIELLENRGRRETREGGEEAFSSYPPKIKTSVPLGGETKEVFERWKLTEKEDNHGQSHPR